MTWLIACMLRSKSQGRGDVAVVSIVCIMNSSADTFEQPKSCICADVFSDRFLEVELLIRNMKIF